MKYVKSAVLFTLAGLIMAGLLGYYTAGSWHGALSSVFVCAVLGGLEVSLSFDNAVINASVLREMDAVWQRRFMTWGMIVAVFGVRLVFPLVIVAFAVQMNPVAVLQLAIYHPEHYAAIVAGTHTRLMGFGGSFLFMVALNYFVDREKKIHWLAPLERPLARLSQWDGVGIALVLLILLVMRAFLPAAEGVSFLVSGLVGLVSYVAVRGIGTVVGPARAASSTVQTGAGLFLYLEVMDASFSFDGVIGAFALSTHLFVIALGLGIGAMFVRSLTYMLVRRGALEAYRYLEHGAFWAIFVLAVLMFISVYRDVSDVVTGGVGLCLIGFSLLSSIWWRKKTSDFS